MNRFTVVWRAEAKAELAIIWMGASDRTAVAMAANKIDAESASDPLGIGDPVSEGLFRLERVPLTALFSIRDADRVVEIEFVRHV